MKEIERKWLVDYEIALKKSPCSRNNIIKQGFPFIIGRLMVRVRSSNDKWTLTLKYPSKSMLVRNEYEIRIPSFLGKILLYISGNRIVKKVRRKFFIRNDPDYGEVWGELDIFSGKHMGLAILEIELKHEDQNPFPDGIPLWIKKEVTYDPNYLNVNLASWKN